MSGRVGWLVVSVAAAVMLTGCELSPSIAPLTESTMEEIRLIDVGELYRMHQMSSKRPPRSLRDFARLGDAAAPTGHMAVQSGQVVVRWEATLPDTELEPTSPSSDEVLAFVSTVPEKGGAVLMLDRRIKRMTPEEFRAAKLAGTDAPASRSKTKSKAREKESGIEARKVLTPNP